MGTNTVIPVLALALAQFGWTITQSPPREVHRLYWELTRETEVWVRLTPGVPQRTVPLVNVVFHAFYPGREGRNPYTGLPKWPKGKPARLMVSAEPSLHTVVRKLSLRFVIDDRTVDLTGPDSHYQTPPCLIASEDCTPNAVEADVTPSLLRSLASARSVSGNALGFPIKLVPADQAAIRRFLERIDLATKGRRSPARNRPPAWTLER